MIISYVKLLTAIVFVSIGVAFTYTLFEKSISYTISLIWIDWLNTNEKRFMIVPIVFILTYVYFWLQHRLDPSQERHETKGLGSMPKPTLVNFGKILLIGFFSLIAGASLGPEAILVPACMLLGAYIGSTLFASNKKETILLTGMGIIALFTAFFGSIAVGLLTIFLVMKQTKSKLTIQLIALGAVTTILTYITLKLIDSRATISLPPYDWHITITTVFWSLVLVAGGYIIITITSLLYDQFQRVYTHKLPKKWWIHASVAAAGLTLLYLVGGPLVQFTGNQSILPLFEQASTLGIFSIIWILFIKTAAIAWSKAIGYRGGMIFPTIFLASALVILVQQFVPDFNAIYGLIAVLIGALIANNKSGILA